MKYLMKSIKETRVYWWYIIRLLTASITIFISLNQIVWITAALTNPSEADKYVNMIIIANIVSLVSDTGMDKVMSLVTHKVGAYFQLMYIDKVLDLDYNAFVELPPSTILTTYKDIWRVINIPVRFINLIKQILMVIIAIISITIIKKEIVIPVVIAYLIMALVGFKLFRKWGECDKKIDDLSHEKSNIVSIIAEGFNEVRSFNTQQLHHDQLKEMLDKTYDVVNDRSNVNTKISALFNVIDSITTVGLVLYLLCQIQLGNIESGPAIASIVLIWRLFDPVIYIIDFADQLSDQLAPLPKIAKVLDYENTVISGKTKLNSFNNSIEFCNVSFRYNDADSVLSDVSFKIKKGQKIGICGPSGGGKSTLMKLVPRFYDVSLGHILIDGINIKDYDINSVRERIGIVSQDMYIFNGTILDNIKYGNQYATITDVEEACRKASILDFIKSLDKKLDTEVGSRGIKLSGGQKQRIALARLFLKNPDIVLLDEATSALDNESETIIQESLNYFKDKTIISVAHRLSTIKDCDCIYVIDNHKIVESGTHEELLAKHGTYAAMQK